MSDTQTTTGDLTVANSLAVLVLIPSGDLISVTVAEIDQRDPLKVIASHLDANGNAYPVATTMPFDLVAWCDEDAIYYRRDANPAASALYTQADGFQRQITGNVVLTAGDPDHMRSVSAQQAQLIASHLSGCVRFALDR